MYIVPGSKTSYIIIGPWLPCANDAAVIYGQIYDGPTALHDSGNPGFYCGEIERSRLFISENNMVKLHFFAESYDDRYQFAVYTRQVSHVSNQGR
jgi:hypothetical protein